MLNSLKPSEGGVPCGPSELVCTPPAERAPGRSRPYPGCHSVPTKGPPFLSAAREGRRVSQPATQQASARAKTPSQSWWPQGPARQPLPSGRSAADRPEDTHRTRSDRACKPGRPGLSRLHHGRRGGPEHARMHEDAALEAWSGTSALSSALQAREVSEQSPPGQPPGMGAGPRKWGGLGGRGQSGHLLQAAGRPSQPARSPSPAREAAAGPAPSHMQAHSPALCAWGHASARPLHPRLPPGTAGCWQSAPEAEVRKLPVF